METKKVLEELGGNVIGIASIVDRTGGKDIGVKLFPAISLDIKTYEADNCPLCQEGSEVVKPGSRKMK